MSVGSISLLTRRGILPTEQYAPSGLAHQRKRFPRADALGYPLTPLRGWHFHHGAVFGSELPRELVRATVIEVTTFASPCSAMKGWRYTNALPTAPEGAD